MPRIVYRFYTSMCCGVVIWYRLMYFSGLLLWHWGKHMFTSRMVKQPWRIWSNYINHIDLLSTILYIKRSKKTYTWDILSFSFLCVIWGFILNQLHIFQSKWVTQLFIMKKPMCFWLHMQPAFPFGNCRSCAHCDQLLASLSSFWYV